MTVKNFTNLIPENRENAIKFGTPGYQASYATSSNPAIRSRTDFFHFRHTSTNEIPHWSHTQLRHSLCAPSKNAVFFFNAPIANLYLDPSTGLFTQSASTHRKWQVKSLNRRLECKVVMDIGRKQSISCLAAKYGVLLTGGLHEGTYAMKSLSVDPETEHTSGIVNTSGNGGINHVQTFVSRRNHLPQAAICANDCFIRILDINTNRFLHNFEFVSPINCSAMSPDGRLRIHVSDDKWPIVSDADTGKLIARLDGHRDHGFACDWSPDGILMATGHQDGVVHVWDARNMKTSIHAIPAEQGGVRSLAFSPLGSGYPVLVMAEPLDFVSVVDAKTFHTKQDIDFFGEISGFAMPSDGQNLFIGNSDPYVGGIMEFERHGDGRPCDDFELVRKETPRRGRRSSHDKMSRFESLLHSFDGPSNEDHLAWDQTIRQRDEDMWKNCPYDWLAESHVNHKEMPGLSATQRRRRNLKFRNMLL